MTPALSAALDALGVIPRAKPQPKPATGPIATVRKGQEPDF